jgi:DNA-binding transcriptional MerR regulator
MMKRQTRRSNRSYTPHDILRRVNRSLRELEEINQEIEDYLKKVDKRRADNRAALEVISGMNIKL